MKNKIYAVRLHVGIGDARTFLVSATTKAGARNKLLDVIGALVEVEVATGEQMYAAGKTGQTIYGDIEETIPEPELPLAEPPPVEVLAGDFGDFHGLRVTETERIEASAHETIELDETDRVTSDDAEIVF